MDAFHKDISLVIYTKDNPERVISMVDKLSGFFCDIVIIDSSTSENFNKMLSRIGNKARIYNLPALGIVEPFQKLGALLAKNDWILHLDDDELPDEELLNHLTTSNDMAGFLIKKLEKHHGVERKSLRFYNRRKVIFSGVIHWGIIPKEDIGIAPKGALIHFERPSMKKWKKYALIESYVIGYKLLWIIENKKWYPGFKKSRSAALFSNIVNLQFKFLGEKLGFLISILELIFLMGLYNILFISKSVETKVKRIKYYILIVMYIFQNFNEKLRMWKELFKHGDLNNYIGLNSFQDFLSLSNSDKKGLDLLLYLMRQRSKNVTSGDHDG